MAKGVNRAAAASADRSLLEIFFSYRSDPLGYLTRCARESGDALVRLRLGPSRFVLLNDPAAIEEVLVTRAKDFRKATVLQSAALPWGRQVLGEGLLTSEGDLWSSHRRMMQHAFDRSHIGSYVETMAASARQLLTSWRIGVARDIHADMLRLSLDILTKALFGTDVGDRTGRVGAAMRTIFESRRLSPVVLIPEWIPIPRNAAIRHALKEMNECAFELIRERRRSALGREDLLSLLVTAVDGEGPLGDEAIRDEVMTLFVAAYDPTAVTLSRAFDLIAKHPEVDDALGREIGSATQNESSDRLWQLPYIEMVVREVLRLYPPGRGIARVAARSCEIAGENVPAGAVVIASQWVTQRDPRYFERPDAFEPERWADGLAHRIPRFAYFPFGGGPRHCLGYGFAMAEVSVVVATIRRELRLTLDPREPTEWDKKTLRPRRGVVMVPVHREPALHQ